MSAIEIILTALACLQIACFTFLFAENRRLCRVIERERNDRLKHVTEIARLRARSEWLTQAAAGELWGDEFDRITALADEIDLAPRRS